MDKDILSVLVEYPAQALQLIGTNKEVVSLLTNNPNIDMNSDEADDVFDKFLFDYGYVDDTTDEANAYVCVEIEIPRIPTPSVKDVRIYVQVFCHKKFMQIDPSKFKGIIGNRRDNLSKQIDTLLNGSDLFGIGTLCLEYARVSQAPAGFSARELSYRVADFKTKAGH